MAGTMTLKATDLKPGDVLLTYGSFGFWPPRRLVIWPVYLAIREYERAKWQKELQTRKDWPTHARLWCGDKFLDVTMPHAKWTTFDETEIGKKKYTVVRWTGAALDIPAMIAEAELIRGTPYDWGDMLDMGIAAFMKWPLQRIFGDRMKKFRVCSTGAARALEMGKATFDRPTSEIDPAYFLAKVHDWQVVHDSKRGKS